ncbi:SKA complex subunit 2-like [Saimiri boliviensis]|uniref:SKA complex subunit 2-like n=1 Tax=Saimiri boliviensis TaxID=27679 RepID=UPI00193CAD8B|nr:spindle and kinetochore-associated protein 2-like [Saimiri boliviensis boliviensis]
MDLKMGTIDTGGCDKRKGVGQGFVFDMKAEVHKLELMFQKAESDLDYIQYRLEYEIKTNHPDSAGKKNPVTLLKELSAIKSPYQSLCARFKPVAVEPKESKSRICAAVNKTMNVTQNLQKQTDLELSPLTEEEKTAQSN